MNQEWVESTSLIWDFSLFIYISASVPKAPLEFYFGGPEAINLGLWCRLGDNQRNTSEISWIGFLSLGFQESTHFRILWEVKRQWQNSLQWQVMQILKFSKLHLQWFHCVLWTHWPRPHSSSCFSWAMAMWAKPALSLGSGSCNSDASATTGHVGTIDLPRLKGIWLGSLWRSTAQQRPWNYINVTSMLNLIYHGIFLEDVRSTCRAARWRNSGSPPANLAAKIFEFRCLRVS